MRAQYYYEPPRSNWLNRLKQPPFSYILIGLAVIVTLYLLYAQPQYGARILILLIAFPIHEFAHALAAYRLGDSTPKYEGRLTLNPLAHLDLFGSLLILVSGFGWAKPVRFNPYGLRVEPRFGSMLVAAAGPLSNLALAVGGAALVWTVLPVLRAMATPLTSTIASLLVFFVFINVALFFLNLIPLSPLDGFTVLRGFLPHHLVYQLDKIQPYSMFIFLAIFITGILGVIIGWPAQMVTALLLGIRL
jgi:Zn-dependent protease